MVQCFWTAIPFVVIRSITKCWSDRHSPWIYSIAPAKAKNRRLCTISCGMQPWNNISTPRKIAYDEVFFYRCCCCCLCVLAKLAPDITHITINNGKSIATEKWPTDNVFYVAICVWNPDALWAREREREKTKPICDEATTRRKPKSIIAMLLSADWHSRRVFDVCWRFVCHRPAHIYQNGSANDRRFDNRANSFLARQRYVCARDEGKRANGDAGRHAMNWVVCVVLYKYKYIAKAHTQCSPTISKSVTGMWTWTLNSVLHSIGIVRYCLTDSGNERHERDSSVLHLFHALCLILPSRTYTSTMYNVYGRPPDSVGRIGAFALVLVAQPDPDTITELDGWYGIRPSASREQPSTTMHYVHSNVTREAAMVQKAFSVDWCGGVRITQACIFTICVHVLFAQHTETHTA